MAEADETLMTIHIGILIATTDRIGIIDQSLLSRPDLAVEFRLSYEIRRQIWTDGIHATGSGMSFSEDNADKMSSIAKHELDGHTITNIIRSASRIARTEQRDVRLTDIEKYLEASNALSKYLYIIHGNDSRGEAMRRKWRLDQDEAG